MTGPDPNDPRFADNEDESGVTSIDLERAKRGIPAGPRSGWASSLVYKEQGRGDSKERVLEPTAGNLAILLINEPSWRGCLGYDQFSEREVWIQKPPELPGIKTPEVGDVCDEHDTYVQQWFHAKRNINVGNVTAAVMAAARANGFHPVKQYLSKLKWDGQQRLPKLLPGYFGAPDSLYSQQIGIRWMISAVARVMRPGCKVDTMLILEGKQGKRKSTALEALTGSQWFADTKLDLSKTDAYQAMRGKWVLEMAELDSLKKQELTRIKAFLTSAKDTYRPSYGKRARDFPRQTIFAGSTNEDKYLSDKTGNRRFWPIAIGTISVDRLAKDRDQLWAEALTRFQAGEHWWLDSDELALITAAEEAQEERMVDEDPWVGLTRTWLEMLSRPTLDNPASLDRWVDVRKGITTTDALIHAIGCRKDGIGHSESTRMGIILRGLGLDNHRVTVGLTRERRYFLPASQD